MRRVHAGGMTCLIPPFHIARSLIAGLRLTRCERAAAMVEMALVLPLFIALAMGILVYGRYFMLAHSVQQAANDGARAAITGLDADDRLGIAIRAVDRSLASVAGVTSDPRSVAVSETRDRGEHTAELKSLM